jgi:membrane protease YdiL (CAAX protease family)
MAKLVVANLHMMASRVPGSDDGGPGDGTTPTHPPPSVTGPSPYPPSAPRPWAATSGSVAPAGVVAPDHGEFPPHTARDARAWLVFAAIGFIGGQLLSTILLVIVAAFTGHSSDVSRLATQPVPPAWVVITGLVGLWFGFVGAALGATRFRGTRSLRRDLGLEVHGWDMLTGPLIGLGGQFLLLPLLYLPLQHVIPHLDQRLKAPARHLTGGFPGSDLAFIAVLTVVVVPVVEELFFRGLVLRGLLRAFVRSGPVIGVTLAVVADGIIFGLAHFEALQLLGLSVFGVVLSLMAYRFRRLGPGIFAHAVFNLLAILSVAGILH